VEHRVVTPESSMELRTESAHEDGNSTRDLNRRNPADCRK